MKKFNSKALLPMIVAARSGTPEQRLAAITACFLVGRFPAGFRFVMGSWGMGHTTLESLLTVDMKKVDHTCNTAGCIAGLSNFLFEEQVSVIGCNGAPARLGLDRSQTFRLFTPEVEPSHKRYEDAGGYAELDKNPVQVGRVLTNFMRTGKIDWSIKARLKKVRVAGVWF